MVTDIRPRMPNLPQEDKNKQDDDLDQANEPAFVPPDLLQQEDGFVLTSSKKPKKQKKPGFSLKRLKEIHFDQASKKHKAIGLAVAIVLVLGGGGGVYALQNHYKFKPAPQQAAATVVKKEEPKPVTEPSKLTGLPIDPGLNKRQVTSIQIENSPDARPQSGLKDAGVVFEAIAEGGITRFNASFQEAQPDYIGPVRSVRPYYVDLAAAFDPIFVHAGGSGDGLNRLKEVGLKDLDGLNAPGFRRVSERYAPHNLYTSMGELDKVAASRNYTSADIKGFARKPEKPGQPVTAGKVDLTMSSALYNVHYDYDPASNAYKRSEGGKPHTDYKSNQQLAPKVVVALAMNYSMNGIYSVYQTSGEGQAFIFQDGQMIQGTWKKTGPRDQFVFVDGNGQSIPINAGQTWITLVRGANEVRFTP